MNRNPYNVSRPGSSGSVGGVEGSIDPFRPPSSNPPSMSMNSEDEDSDGRGKKILSIHNKILNKQRPQIKGIFQIGPAQPKSTSRPLTDMLQTAERKKSFQIRYHRILFLKEFQLFKFLPFTLNLVFFWSLNFEDL